MSNFARNCSFWPPEANTMNTFRWNLVCKCRPWVYSSTPNLIVLGKRGSVQESPKVTISLLLWFWPPEADTINTFRWNLSCFKCSSSPLSSLPPYHRRASLSSPSLSLDKWGRLSDCLDAEGGHFEHYLWLLLSKYNVKMVTLQIWLLEMTFFCSLLLRT